MSTTKVRRTTETHKVFALFIDHAYQRAEMPGHVEKIAANLSLADIGVLTVNARDDGTLSVIDGQHRKLALEKNGLGKHVVKCDVFHGLSLEEEAAKFLALNAQRLPNAWDRFRAGLIAGDPNCHAIVDDAQAAGWTVSDQVGNAKIAAVAALIAMQNAGTLKATLDVVTAAWGHDKNAADGHILKGVSGVVGSYNGELDRAVLVQKISKRTPAQMIASGRAWKALHGGSVSKCISLSIVDLYNRGRRTGQLPPL